MFILVKTCGVPMIDASEMENKTVGLGDQVTFNCKVGRDIINLVNIQIHHQKSESDS